MRITTVCLSAVVVLAGLAGSSRPARAQRLGDVAKQEEERRKDVKTPSKVYTNKDLGTPPASASGAASPDSPRPPSAPAPAADDKAKDAAKDGPAKDQKYWSARKKEIDAKLERDKVLADAMQSRINGLNTDFAARSDPAQRAIIERDRQRALAEFDGLQKSIKDDQKAVGDLDDEARKAGVPPGWLR